MINKVPVEDHFWGSVHQILNRIGFNTQSAASWARHLDDTVSTCVSRLTSRSPRNTRVQRIMWDFALPGFPAGAVYETCPCGPTVGTRSLVDFCQMPRDFEMYVSFPGSDVRLEFFDPLTIDPDLSRELGLQQTSPEDPVVLDGFGSVVSYLEQIIAGPFNAFTSRYGTRLGLVDLLSNNVEIARRELRAPFFTSRADRFIPWLQGSN